MMQPVFVLPLRWTLSGWSNGLTGISWSSARICTKSCAWEGVTPCTSTGWGPTSWKAAVQRKPQEGLEDKLTVSQQCTLMAKKASDIPCCILQMQPGRELPADEEVKWPLPLHLALVKQVWILCPVWGSPSTGETGQVHQRAMTN